MKQIQNISMATDIQSAVQIIHLHTRTLMITKCVDQRRRWQRKSFSNWASKEALSRGSGSPKSRKQEPAEVQKERLLERKMIPIPPWRQLYYSPSSLPRVQHNVNTRLISCRMELHMPRGWWEEAGGRWPCMLQARRARRANDPGKVLAPVTSFTWPSVTWSGRPPVWTVVFIWRPPISTLKPAEGGRYRYACVHHCWEVPSSMANKSELLNLIGFRNRNNMGSL